MKNYKLSEEEVNNIHDHAAGYETKDEVFATIENNELLAGWTKGDVESEDSQEVIDKVRDALDEWADSIATESEDTTEEVTESEEATEETTEEDTK